MGADLGDDDMGAPAAMRRLSFSGSPGGGAGGGGPSPASSDLEPGAALALLTRAIGRPLLRQICTSLYTATSRTHTALRPAQPARARAHTHSRTSAHSLCLRPRAWHRAGPHTPTSGELYYSNAPSTPRGWSDSDSSGDLRGFNRSRSAGLFFFLLGLLAAGRGFRQAHPASGRASTAAAAAAAAAGPPSPARCPLAQAPCGPTGGLLEAAAAATAGRAAAARMRRLAAAAQAAAAPPPAAAAPTPAKGTTAAHHPRRAPCAGTKPSWARPSPPAA